MVVPPAPLKLLPRAPLELAAPTWGVGQSVLHREAIVEAPSVHNPLRRICAANSWETVEGVRNEAVRYVVTGCAVVRTVISVRVVPVLGGALSERVLREIKCMRPSIVGVKLDVFEGVVDDLANQRAVVRVNVADHLRDGRETRGIGSEESGVSVAGVDVVDGHGTCRDWALAGCVRNGDRSGHAGGCRSRAGNDVDVKEVGHLATQRTKITD